MQQIIIEKPYKFIPPHRGKWWPQFIRDFNLQGLYLRKTEGIFSHEIRGVEHLVNSLQAGHGIMLAPNHSRSGDPLLMGWVGRAAKCNVYAMASWHLFHQHWFNAWAIRKMGGFSVNREGVDRQAINTAIEILTTAERPLVLFPEGAVSRTNDRLMALLDGVAFIARAAAKKRAKMPAAQKVVIHPVGIKYLFRGDILRAADDVLTDIEHRLTWRPHRELPVIDRLAKAGRALLTLKELEYFGEVQKGTLAERLDSFIDRLLQPLELEWLGEAKGGAVVPRVKALRMRILPDMTQGKVESQERQRRWRHLAALYLAQQLSCYPPDYLTSRPSVDRVLETIERFEEDLTDRSRVHGHLHAVIAIGEPIEVTPERDRKAAVDPLMATLDHRLQGILDQLALESPLLNDPSAQSTAPAVGQSLVPDLR
jgi:1-acyl-sn-glycerol-3-phosphate acyltransferase